MCEYCGNPTHGMDCMDCHCAICASCLLGELCPDCAADNWWTITTKGGAADQNDPTLMVNRWLKRRSCPVRAVCAGCGTGPPTAPTHVAPAHTHAPVPTGTWVR